MGVIGYVAVIAANTPCFAVSPAAPPRISDSEAIEPLCTAAIPTAGLGRGMSFSRLRSRGTVARTAVAQGSSVQGSSSPAT